MQGRSTAQLWMTLGGIVLVAVGLLGFADTLHNLVHLGTGLLVGILYVVIFLAVGYMARGAMSTRARAA